MSRLAGTAFELYGKAKRFGTWDPAALDLTQDGRDIEQLAPEERDGLIWFCSAFHDGETSVATTLSAWILANPDLCDQMYLSTQLYEEMKHTEFFVRYFAEVFGCAPHELNPEGRDLAWTIGAGLDALAEELQRSVMLDSSEREALLIRGVVHYHLVVEGVIGMSAYDTIGDWLGSRRVLPGLKEGFAQIKADEGRHIAYGIDYTRRALARRPDARVVVERTFGDLVRGALTSMGEPEQQRARHHAERRLADIGVELAQPL